METAANQENKMARTSISSILTDIADDHIDSHLLRERNRRADHVSLLRDKFRNAEAALLEANTAMQDRDGKTRAAEGARLIRRLILPTLPRTLGALEVALLQWADVNGETPVE